MKKLNNKEKLKLVLQDLESYTENNEYQDSLNYAYNNGYFLHAANLWLSTGAVSENILEDIKGLTINQKDEAIEIAQLCKEAYIYRCKDCNYHMFLETDEGDDIQCESCLKIATITE